jgi:spermidine synthase
VREGQLATLAHVKHRLHGLPLFDQLATNAYSMSVNDFAARRYMDLFAVLPAAVHPHIRSALVIGYGIGNTARALTALPELERVEVVDISPDILTLARAIRPPSGQHPLLDPRVHVRIDDGRFFLEASRAHFDLITGEPPPPIMGGVAGLYSTEYFERMHERLAQGGIATYWLPMINISAATGRSIIAAFCAAFEDCSLWNGSAKNFILMGTRNAGEHGAVSEQRFTAQWNDPALLPELRAIGLELPGQLGALFIGDASYLRELTREDPPLTDDWPRRMQRPGTGKERDDLIWQWRDTRAARQRFVDSALIEKLWPPHMVGEALRNFENQRLITDLLFPGRTAARQVPVLHQVLTRSPLQLPLLLMLGSDPDIQAALQRAGSGAERPEWALHRAAGQLARRDVRAASISLRDVPDTALPLTGLRSYLLETSE